MQQIMRTRLKTVLYASSRGFAQMFLTHLSAALKRQSFLSASIQYSFFTIALFSIHLTQTLAPITKVIVPMAGLGTRVLPLTKSISKSMLPVVGKPALHHVVDEALQSDITNFCFIINAEEQDTIEYYFSSNTLLDSILKERKKEYLLAQLNASIARASFTYVAQPEPLGLGHAVLLGEQFVGPDQFFCVMLPDNIIESNDPHMAMLIAIAQKYNASVITIEEVTKEEASKYAVITPRAFLNDNLIDVADIIEKPRPDQVHYCLGQVGRHVLSSDVFESLKVIKPGAGGEIQLTDAVKHMIQQGKRVLAYKLDGKRYDTGNIRGLLEATVSVGLHDPLYRDMLISIFKKECL